MYRIFVVQCVASAAVALLCTSSAIGRGATPPPPRLFTGGSTGGWLGSGPLFGFDDPLGHDFFPGDGSTGGGTNGFELGGSNGGAGSGIPESNGCATCRCNIWVPKKRDCDPTCACQFSERNPVRGKQYPGYCAKAWDMSMARSSCCQPGESCWTIPIP